MKVAGFTFIRNAIKYDYPIIEAITSVLPLCDEFVVAVGNSDDGTLALIEGIGSPKIRIIHTIWDEALREGGQVLAVETDKAFRAISPDVDWAFYIQGDEAISEVQHPIIRAAMERYLADNQVDGLLFDYLHFYGSYQYLGDSPRWYRREVRIVRNRSDIYSYRDAQGFRKGNDQKLCVKPVSAQIYHYGWVKNPEKQQAKAQSFNKLWHSDEWVKQNVKQEQNQYDYYNIDSLKLFAGKHPSVMQARIERADWVFEFDVNRKNMKLKYLLRYWLEKITGYRPFEYKNYRIV